MNKIHKVGESVDHSDEKELLSGACKKLNVRFLAVTTNHYEASNIVL